MKKYFICLLLTVSTAANAGGISGIGGSVTTVPDNMTLSQWKVTGSSLNDLLQSGYTIVSVIADPLQGKKAGKGSSSNEIFYLQKGASAAKCGETHINNYDMLTSDTYLICWTLVEPYQEESKVKSRNK